MIDRLLFPPLCVHCETWIAGKRKLFCDTCVGLLHLLDPESRCYGCFSSLEMGVYCPRCREKSNPCKRVASALEYRGPAATLIQRLKSGEAPYLAKHLAAFMVVQLERLKWPWPDFLVPVPISWPHLLKRGYNQSQLLADEMGQLMQVPVWNPLQKSSAALPQTGQSREQREKLLKECFSWKHFQNRENTTLLLIDDVITTATTLRHCATLLQEASPKGIYGLVVCLA